MTPEIQLEVFRFGSDEFKQYLTAHIYKDYRGNREVFKKILRLLATRYPSPCRSVVIEEPYVCKDYLDEFTGFYAASFKNYPATCKRLHFFATEVSPRTAFDFAKYRSSYLGFVVIRPTDLQKVGRSILKAPCEDPENEFVLCKTPNNAAHLLTAEFEVDATPFIQQDTQVGACATAAMWSAARYLSRKLGTREFYPSEITAAARETLTLGRTFPAKEGLTGLQIVEGLSHLGYETELLERRALRPSPLVRAMSGETENEALQDLQFARIVYRYVESEMPVILLLPRHAVLAIGHTYDPDQTADLTIQKIPHLIVHDDARGPYGKLPVRPDCNDGQFFPDVEKAVFIMPPECKMRGQDAEDGAVQFLLWEFLGSLDPEARGLLGDTVEIDMADPVSVLRQLFVRTILRPNIELKKEMLDLTVPQRIRRRIARTPLPKYVWMLELSTQPQVSKEAKRRRRRIGEIVIDSTAPAQTNMVLFFRLGPLWGFLDRDDPSFFSADFDARHIFLPQWAR